MRVILYMLSAAVLILSASCSHADRGGKVETEVPRTSMDPEGLGGWQVLVYEGILPEASGDGKTCVKLTMKAGNTAATVRSHSSGFIRKPMPAGERCP